MKKVFYLFAALIGAFGCSKIDTANLGNEKESVTIEVATATSATPTSSNASTPSTRVGLVEDSESGNVNVRWIEGDELNGFSAKDNSFSKFSMVASSMASDGSKASFTGEVSGNTLRFIYPYKDITTASSVYNIDLSIQSVDMDQKEMQVSKTTYLISSMFNVTESNVAPTMKHIGAAIKVGMKFSGLKSGSSYKISSISLKSASFKTSANVDLTKECDAADFITSSFGEQSYKVNITNSPVISNPGDIAYVTLNILPTTIQADEEITLTVTLKDAATNEEYSDSFKFSHPEDINLARASHTGFNYLCEFLLGDKGDGSEQNPYILSTKADLFALNAKLSSSTLKDEYYRINRNIDLEGETWNVPANSFEGYLDGENHTISNLVINTEIANSHIGFFNQVGYENGGTWVKNLNIVGNITTAPTAQDWWRGIGSIAGVAYFATIENCTFSGTITATAESNNVGGVVGKLDRAKMINCSNSATISVNKITPVGGVVARCEASEAIGCSNSGKITVKPTTDNGNTTPVGGVAGLLNNNATLINSYNSGDVETDFGYTAGVVGKCEDNASKLLNCYNTGNVHSYYKTGGVVGASTENALINNCYNIGEITCDLTEWCPYPEDGFVYDIVCGGVIGESYGNQNVYNTFYLDNTKNGVGMDQYTNYKDRNNLSGEFQVTKMTATEMTDGTLLSKLNTNAATIEGAATWIAGADSYPVLVLK